MIFLLSKFLKNDIIKNTDVQKQQLEFKKNIPVQN